MPATRWITLDPGHFHAALVQKQMHPGVDPTVHVYAPLGPDLAAHVQRIADFNHRSVNPTAWALEIHASTDYLERLVRERPGNVVILSGRNRRKIEYLRASIAAGLHVLADKPWILVPEDLPLLRGVLEEAEKKSLVALDIMTERFEITSVLQRALVNDPEVFGRVLEGSPEQPGVFMESTHYLYKSVAGVPLRRPTWYFDVNEQGEGLSDVGVHLVDLAAWILFPESAIDADADVQILAAQRWPRILTRTDFRRVTGAADFPPYLTGQLQSNCLPYFCNNRVVYRLRGVHVVLNVLWDFESPPGGTDTHLAVFRGTRSRVEVRQERNENYIPELYVTPNRSADRAPLAGALANRIRLLQAQYPGIDLIDYRDGWWIRIPDEYRIGHEAHFTEVVRRFLGHIEAPQSLPAWEKPNMVAKYRISTEGVALARRAAATEGE